MHTTFGTWTSLFGTSIDDLDLDPHGELNLNDEQRQEMNRTARTTYMEFVEDLLGKAYPEAEFMIDRFDGDVLCLREASIDTESPEWEDLAHEVQMGPDFDDLLDEYIALADENGADSDEDDEDEDVEDVEEPVEKTAPYEQRIYAGLIPDEAYTYLASLHVEKALHRSGELSDRLNSTDVRLAFIARTRYVLFLRALRDMRAAENEKLERKALAAVFAEAHAEAATKFQAAQEAIRTGQVMTGQIFRGLAYGLGLTDEALADALGVRDVRTIRHWKAGKREIPAGVMAEMWEMWDRFLTHAKQIAGGGGLALIGEDAPAALVAAVAVLAGRVATSPARPTQPWIQ
ncbi:hypothetical protein INS90_10045 [Trueperella pecoris]|uniref:Uncharacterized protein n=1 Tax=Trueperella pecoris TaxID=2733571 RepID=A0A7M1QZY1_9ACTO|nr:hypothetical protein [Trueperella pecoris]QOR47570.1 hypothetical protein INS90_10045 [Trueperella pecoris]